MSRGNFFFQNLFREKIGRKCRHSEMLAIGYLQTPDCHLRWQPRILRAEKTCKGANKKLYANGEPTHIEFSCFLPAWNRSVFCNPSLCLPVSDPPSFLGAFSFDGDKARQGRSNPLRCEDSRELFAAAPGRENPDTAHKKKRRARSSRERSGSRRTAPIPYIFRRFPGNPGESRLVFSSS